MTPDEARAQFRFIEPYEIRRGDGKRGIAVALIARELFVITLRDGETWSKHPEHGIIIFHPFLAVTWCRFHGYTYVRSELKVH